MVRMRGKQKPPPMRQGTTLITQNAFAHRTGPRLGATAEQIKEGSFSEAELKSIAAFPVKHQTRERKRLIHNRTAIARGKHVINPVLVDDTTVSCQNCDLVSALCELCLWQGDKSISKCFGNEASRAEFIELQHRNEAIRKHNLTADKNGRHTLTVLGIHSNKIACTICGISRPLSGPDIYQMRARSWCAQASGQQKVASTSSSSSLAAPRP